MSRLFLLLTIQFSFGIIINAQQVQIKEGAYRTIVDFHKNKPFSENEFKFKIRKDNIYVIDNKKSAPVMEIWAIYQDSAFYINLARLRMGNGFAKVTEFGRYSFFLGKLAMTAAQRDRMIKNTFDFGVIGALYSDIQRRRENRTNNFFVINLQKGMPQNLYVNHMSFILRDEEDLLNKYLQEPGKEDMDTMLAYLKEINSRHPIY